MEEESVCGKRVSLDLDPNLDFPNDQWLFSSLFWYGFRLSSA